MDTSLKDYEGGMGRTPVISEDEVRRKDEEACLGGVLIENGQPWRESFKDEFLQKERIEGPEKEKRPDHDAEEVVIFKSVVKIGIEEVVIFDFVEEGLGEEEDEDKDNHHVVETSEARLVKLRVGIAFVDQSGRTCILFLCAVGGSDVGVIPGFIIFFH